MTNELEQPMTRDEKRERWGDGPWLDEPDREEWRSPAGYPCLIVRGPLGVWCGYVAVPKGHPWYEQEPRDADAHGGITYADHCAGKICHVPKPGEPDDVWWVGFDCGHAGDFSPGIEMASRRATGRTLTAYSMIGGEYRTYEYARAEVAHLAEQAEAAAR